MGLDHHERVTPPPPIFGWTVSLNNLIQFVNILQNLHRTLIPKVSTWVTNQWTLNVGHRSPDTFKSTQSHPTSAESSWKSVKCHQMRFRSILMKLFLLVTLKCCFCCCLGDRYVVVDCGGGTVDLTVHQIQMPEGHLKELYKASGTRHNPYDLYLEISLKLLFPVKNGLLFWNVIISKNLRSSLSFHHLCRRPVRLYWYRLWIWAAPV